MDLPGNSQPSPRAGCGPPEPPRMVGRVLNGNGITELQQGRTRLIGSVAVRLVRRSRAGLALAARP